MSFNLKFEMDDDNRKKRQADSRGYIDIDIPILKDWDLYENNKLREDITPEEIYDFINWLSDGPIYPVPSMAKKILCVRRTKLISTISSWSTTAGERQHAQRLLDSIDEILKEGDDSFDPESVCSNQVQGNNACENSQIIQIPDDCCKEMRKELALVKETILAKLKKLSDSTQNALMSDEDKAEEARKKSAQAIAEAKSAYEHLQNIQQKHNVTPTELEAAINSAEASRLKAEMLIHESERLFEISNSKKCDPPLPAIQHRLHPVVLEQQPVVPEEQPIVPEEQPVVPEEHPVVPEEHPVVPEEQPVVPEEQPVVPEEQPVVPEEQPVVSGQQPVVPEEQPVVSGQQPVVPGQQPVVPGHHNNEIYTPQK